MGKLEHPAPNQHDPRNPYPDGRLETLKKLARPIRRGPHATHEGDDGEMGLPMVVDMAWLCGIIPELLLICGVPFEAVFSPTFVLRTFSQTTFEHHTRYFL